jgi:hypothetical protein
VPTSHLDAVRVLTFLSGEAFGCPVVVIEEFDRVRKLGE